MLGLGLSIPEIAVRSSNLVAKNLKTDFGAKGDTQQLTATISIASGLKALSATTNLWAAGDVGKNITIGGAGAGGIAMTSTITAFTDAQHVTINDAASTTLTNSSQMVLWGTNDAPAFASFNTACQGLSVALTIPAGIYAFFNASNAQGARFVQGLKRCVVSGYGATLTSDMVATSPGVGDGSGFWLGALATFAHTGAGGGTNARIATVSAGAKTLTILNPGSATLPTTPCWAMMGGFDMQGGGSAPPNQGIFEYVFITSIVSPTVTIQSPLKNSYKSTWPLYSAGDAFSPDEGGPATLFFLDPTWDLDVEYQGITFQHVAQVNNPARSVKYTDCNFPGPFGAGFGPVPSQNASWTAQNVNASTCGMEVDKLVDVMTINGGSQWLSLDFQSSSVNQLNATSSTVSSFIHGLAKKAALTSTTVGGQFSPGAHSFGASIECDAANCSFNSVVALGVIDKGGLFNLGVNNAYSMSGGVITIPAAQNVTGTANNGSGLIRLALASASAWSTGMTARVVGVGGTTEANGTWVVTFIDSTHVDLQGSAFVHAWTSGGTMGGDGLPASWAIPNTNCVFAGQRVNEGSPFQVVDVTQDSVGTHVTTSLAGGFPNLPLSSGQLWIQVHPAPKITWSGNSGCADAIDLSQTPAGNPLYSYSKRTFDGSVQNSASFPVWGAITSVKINVTQPYTGTQGTLTASIGLFKVNAIDPGGALSNYQPIVNLKIAGERDITATTITGAKSGDTLTAPGAIWFDDLQTINLSADVSGETAAVRPIFTVEFITNQSVV